MTMFDRIHTSPNCITNSLSSSRVSRHLAPRLVSFFDDDAHFFDGKRWVDPICIDLDKIRAVADLLANGAPGFFDAADHLRAAGKVQQIRRHAEWVVLTKRGNGPRGHLHARAFD